MIRAHEDAYCPKCKTWTLGPHCQWCCGTETHRFSPEQESARARHYRRFRAAGADHDLAMFLLGQESALLGVDQVTNDRAVRELVVREPRERRASRPLISPVPSAVAA